jgi:hypothetical protein
MTRLPSPTHTIWLREQQAAFIYLPKVACTSWKLFLGRALGLADGAEISYANVHDGAALALPYLSSFPADAQQHFQRELNRGAIHRFAVIREPRERALSAYLDKILLHHNPSSYFSLEVLPDIRAFHTLSANAIPSFEQFLQWIINNGSNHCRNDHWIPMTTLLGIETDDLSATSPVTIWPMTHIDQAASHLGGLLGFTGNFPSREDLGSRPDRQSSERLLAYRTPAIDELLEQIYADDLSLYGRVSQSQAMP